MLRNNLMLPTEALDIPEAIDFDGTNDYLSRSSDLVGNTDGKTFTFSAWVWWDGTTTNIVYCAGSSSFYLQLESGNILYVFGKNSSGTLILSLLVANALTKNTFNHIVLSVSLVSTASRYIYVNDLLPSSDPWGVYTNDTVDFTQASHKIGAFGDNNYKLKGRLSHVYLDYTYRDLSVEANRRLFITADRKPAANQQALNPILYLPLNDPTQPGKNLGTGGDFNLNGVIARSGRGPNQFNAPYSDLNGSTQYLSRTSALVGVADGKQVTFSCVFNADTLSAPLYPAFIHIGPATNVPRFRIDFANGGAGYFDIVGFNTAGAVVLQGRSQGAALSTGRNNILTASVDLSDISKRYVYVNGQQVTMDWMTFTNQNIALNNAIVEVGRSGGNQYWDGRLGNVFFDTKYIDLSQPANLAKFVTGTGIDAKPADLGANGELPFGTAPLIYLPMYGNNAGKNYGTGGDFTVNSGPYTGARGPNEFWGNKADFNGSASTILTRASALAGVSNSKTFSLSLFGTEDSFSSTDYILDMATSGGSNRLNIYATASLLTIQVNNSSGSPVLDWQISSHGIVNATPFYMTLQIDLTNQTNCKLYINGVQKTGTFYAFANDFIDFAGSSRVSIGRDYIGSSGWDGKLSEFYFTTSYIDFSQEANRLKFRDAFGNPVDLAPQINAGTLPNPAIYMRFPPDNFGKNYGTGGDFTVNGIITDGGQL